MSNPLLDDFYRSIIKAKLPLSVRSEIGDLLANSSRKYNSRAWNECLAFSEELAKPLAFLIKFGYLQLSFESARSLADDLNSLPSTGQPSLLAGNRTEVENLSGVYELKSVQNLINDKSLRALVSLYLGAPARLHTCQAWWQYPMGKNHKPSNAQLWHRDRDDLSEIKLFFYGTDVTPGSGPHAYIPQSHTSEGLSKIFSSDALNDSVVNGTDNRFVEDSYFLNHGFSGDFKKWTGSAGTCFLEDTRGFHRAYIPTVDSRLLLSLVWTVGPGFDS